MARRFLHISDILNAKWLLSPQFAEAYYPLVFNLLQGNLVSEETEDQKPVINSARIGSSNVYFISEYGEASPPELAPKNSIAVLSIKGAITKYDQFCGSAGIETKAALFDRAMSNPNIKGLVLDIDSGGGDANATEFFASKIKQATKPVVSLVTGMAASAAYWIGSAASRMILNGKTTEVGSIGTYIQIADFTEYYKQKGIDVRRIYAPQSTEKNKAYEAALAGDDKPMKEDLKQFTQFFIDAVNENRADKLQKEDGMFKGAMYFAEQAISIGMADQMGTMEDAVSVIEELASGSSNSSTSNQSNMKVMISKSMGAIATVLALQFAADQNEQEVELTAEHLASLNAAITNAEKKSQDLQTKVSGLESKQTELQTEVDRLKAFEPAGTTVEKSKEAAAAEGKDEEKYASVDYANKQLNS